MALDLNCRIRKNPNSKWHFTVFLYAGLSASESAGTDNGVLEVSSLFVSVLCFPVLSAEP